MSFINQIEGIFSANVPTFTFTIYTNQAVQPEQEDADISQFAAITFNCLYDLAFKHSVNVAYEPLENSQFSSDSLQQTPFTIFMTGIQAPFANSRSYSNDDYLDSLEDVSNQLEQYLTEGTLLTIIKERPVFTAYNNLKLTSYSYDLSPEHNNLKAFCTFQEIRVVDTTQFGTLQQSQVSNPVNSSPVNNGAQSPVTPSATTTSTLTGSPS